MDLVTIGTGNGKVWINQAMVEWFWMHEGQLAVKFVGETEMHKFAGITAEEFARLLDPPPIV